MKSAQNVPEHCVKMVPLGYWKCDKPSHHHATKAHARMCIENANRMGSVALKNNWDSENRAVVLELFESGAALELIGRAYGVSRERIRQVLAQAKRDRQWTEDHKERE